MIQVEASQLIIEVNLHVFFSKIFWLIYVVSTLHVNCLYAVQNIYINIISALLYTIKIWGFLVNGTTDTDYGIL